MSPHDDYKLVIEGVREDGSKFRPSDWIERISATLEEVALQPHIVDSQLLEELDRIGEGPGA